MFGLSLARKLAAVRPGDRLVLAEASLALLVAKACVERVPFRVWTRALELATAHFEAGARIPWATVRRVVWAVDASARHLPGDLTCLPRAVATRMLLGRRHIPSVLQVGVARDDGPGLESHAWVECDGEVVIGSLPDLARFAPLYRLDGSTARASQREAP